MVAQSESKGPLVAGLAVSLVMAIAISPLAGPAGAGLGVIGVLLAGRLGRVAAGLAALGFCALAGIVAALTGEVDSAVPVFMALFGTAVLFPFEPETAPAPPAEPAPPPAPSAPEPRLAALDAVIPDWVLRVDKSHNVVASNHPPGELFPDVTDGHIGRPVGELFEPTVRPVIADNLARTFKLHRSATFEYFRRVGHKNYFAEMRILPDGADAVWLIARDITTKRGREEALRESKERFALAIQGANDGLWDWDLRTDEVYYSHRWKAQLGYEADDIGTGPNEWLDRVHPEDAHRVKEDLRAHLDGQAPRYESEHRIRDNDGDWMWVLTRGMAVRDNQGKATRIAGSMTDLTRRRVVAATAEKSRLLEHATRAVGIGIAMRTRKHQLVEPSPMLLEMVAAWQGVDHWWDSLQDTLELPPSVDCPSCSARQIVGSTRVHVHDPTGAERVFELTFTGHGHEVQHDQLVNVVLIEDVTTPALAEERLHRLNEELVFARDQALASSRAKSAFLANMSHELRTPLNAIIGYSEMLLEDAEDQGSESVEDLQRIHGAGSHLLGLIAGILDLSKVEAGIMQVELAEISVDDLVGHVRTTASPLARDNAFVVDAREGLGRLKTDGLKLRQILLNLLSNAFKFTDGGTVTLQARGDLTHVTFRVIDDGIGIDPAKRDSLFDEFVQGDLSSTKAFQGAGLGLALVKRFAELLGGSVTVDSELGKGSTFTVVLPRDPELDPDTETIEVDVSSLADISILPDA